MTQKEFWKRVDLAQFELQMLREFANAMYPRPYEGERNACIEPRPDYGTTPQNGYTEQEVKDRLKFHVRFLDQASGNLAVLFE